MMGYLCIIIGFISAVIAAALAMSAGIWGCGFHCELFNIIFWASVAVIGYGIWLVRGRMKMLKP
jgi:hypothetical protein